MSDTFDFAALRTQLGSDVTFAKNMAKPTGGYPCALCGKECPNPTHLVRFVEGGLSTVATDEYADRPENQPGDMGGYPVGPACARKIRKVISEADFNHFFSGLK